jgi:hypothetical protein
VGLDGLWAEEELGSDLAVGLAVDRAAGDLEFASGERLESFAAGAPGWERRCAQRAQFALGGVAVAYCAAFVEVARRALEDLPCAFALAGRRECRPARMSDREASMPAPGCSTRRRRARGGRALGVAGVQCDGGRGPVRLGDLDGPRLAVPDRAERLVEQRELRRPPDEGSRAVRAW